MACLRFARDLGAREKLGNVLLMSCTRDCASCTIAGSVNQGGGAAIGQHCQGLRRHANIGGKTGGKRRIGDFAHAFAGVLLSARASSSNGLGAGKAQRVLLRLRPGADRIENNGQAGEHQQNNPKY
jgi:hypothetical protein